MTDSAATPPNILLIVTDQQRSDMVGVARQYDGTEGHPVLQTPTLNYLAETGARFERCYSDSPVCIPARRTLLTGRTPEGHGVPGFYDTSLPFPTLPSVLRDAGYQTALCGKLHLWPLRRRHGFEEFRWADGPGSSPEEGDSDYLRFMRSLGHGDTRRQVAHGIAGESSHTRPWHLSEREHITTWTADQAVDFLDRRDPTRPFFLNVGFFHPHPPTTPPRDYMDRYLRIAERDPEPFVRTRVGEWARRWDEPRRGRRWNDPRQHLPPQELLQFRAAYWAQLNHIDDQITRILERVDYAVGLDTTLVVFTSDHGEMFGDQQWMRKRVPWEPSARVPLLIRPPGGLGDPLVIDDVVSLADVMPTVLEAAGVEVPPTVQGRSVLPAVGGTPHDTPWRDVLFGECSDIGTGLDAPTGMHFAVTSPHTGDFDRHWKYCWFPGVGLEQLFDLDADPAELHDLGADASARAPRALLRSRLVEHLRHRPEGFVVDDDLARLGGTTPPYLPGFEREGPSGHEGSSAEAAAGAVG